MSNPPMYDGNFAALKVGDKVMFKNGAIAEKGAKRFKIVKGASAAKMAEISKKRRGGTGKGKGRRQAKPADGSKVTPMTKAKDRKAFHDFYNKVGAIKFPDDPKKAAAHAAKLKAGDISQTASAKRPLDPKKPSHRILHASNPKKYDIAGIDTPGSVTKSPNVKKALKEIEKKNKAAIKTMEKIKKKNA